MAAVTYPLGHKIKSAPPLSAPQVLAQAQALGVVLALSNGALRARGPQASIAELAQHIRACKPELVKLLLALPPAVVASPSPPVPAQTWREADKADQQHYWNCAQCLAVVKSGTGKRCTPGQLLHDAYIEAATLEGRFRGRAG
jgi:hypothetical protein